MKFLFLEPFFGGSHRQFAQGWARYSCHTIELVTLPARFWKWRMRGAALAFIEQVARLADYDGLITSGLMSLADFKALANGVCPPALVYFHENQLTYPLSPGETMDYQYGFTNITTALTAQKILFNSNSHKNAFLDALPAFIKMMPDCRPNWVVEAISAKSQVLYPGCDFEQAPQPKPPSPSNQTVTQHVLQHVPLIIWNHRWEFDKQPDIFFKTLAHVAARGYDFRLALLGERFNAIPEVFTSAQQHFSHRIVQYGYAASRQDYIEWLRQGDLVISTACQENFGIAVVEAVRHGCWPLLPDRLSYPEIIPKQFHSQVLYTNDEQLVDKICHCLAHLAALANDRYELANAMNRFTWSSVIEQYDRVLDALVQPVR
jgi:glycosyltransferase involved in cell wall biosynthesis